jgi:hypothetical protein
MKEQYKLKLSKLNEKATSPSSIVGHSIAVGFGDAFNHHFIINNESSQAVELTLGVEDIDEALNLISEFSNEPKRLPEEAKEKFKFDINRSLYLHYFRTPKVL